MRRWTKRAISLFRSLMAPRALTSKAISLLADRSSRNGLLSLAQALLTIVTYFLVMRHVVVALGLEALGLWSLTMSLVAFVRMLDLGLAHIPARMVAAKTGDGLAQARVVDSSAFAGLGAFVLMGIASYYALRPVLIGSLEPVLHAEAIWLLLGIVAVLPLNSLALVHLGAIDGIGRADIRALVAIAGLLLYAGAALLLIRPYGIMALVYAQLVQHGLALVVARVLLRSRIAALGLFPVRFCLSVLKEAASFGVRLQFSTLPMALFDPLCRLLIGRLAGLELLAIYELASKFAASTRTLVQAFANPLLPELARLLVEDRPAARARYSVSQTVISSLGLLVSTAQILALPMVSCLLLGGFDPAFILVSAVLSLAWGVTCIGLVPQLYARAAGRLRHAMVGQWLLLVLGGLLVPFASLLRDALWMLVAPGLAILIGHLVAFAGEVRHFGLNPVGNGTVYRIVGLVFALTLVASAATALFAMAMGASS